MKWKLKMYIHSKKNIKMKKTLVIGASTNEDRFSNMAINLLRKHDIEVVAFGLRKGTIADVKIDTERQNYNNIDTVTMYINPQRQPEFYDYILSLKPQRVIFNPGTENDEFIEILEQNNISTIENCTLVMLNNGLF